ncbi:MAG: hypothetical protein BroJett025_11370 [Patescibacteria group bacterium]|nr:MAG: hypothetical protein BroJett025_11370 [Patescibacteria group bacterium]
MQKTRKTNKQHGFTMIELLVVIVILGILSVIGLGSFSSSQMKARDSRRKTDLRAISDALEVYYNDFGSYPLSDGDGTMLGCGAAAAEACTQGTIWQNADNDTTYMVQIPEDPNGGRYYYISSDGTYFQIYAHLENDQDRDVPLDVNGDPGFYSNPEADSGSNACVTGDCNYGRSSTNIDLGAIY